MGIISRVSSRTYRQTNYESKMTETLENQLANISFEGNFYKNGLDYLDEDNYVEIFTERIKLYLFTDGKWYENAIGELRILELKNLETKVESPENLEIKSSSTFEESSTKDTSPSHIL